MIKGLRTVTYPVPDLDQAKAWYSQVFNTAPYFDQPFYVGFAIGGFELGLLPGGEPGTQGSVTYWGVDGIEQEVERIVALGGTLHHPITDVGRRHPHGGIARPVRQPDRPDRQSPFRDRQSRLRVYPSRERLLLAVHQERGQGVRRTRGEPRDDEQRRPRF